MRSEEISSLSSTEKVLEFSPNAQPNPKAASWFTGHSVCIYVLQMAASDVVQGGTSDKKVKKVKQKTSSALAKAKAPVVTASGKTKRKVRKPDEDASGTKHKKARLDADVVKAEAPAAEENAPARQRWQRLDEETVQYYSEVCARWRQSSCTTMCLLIPNIHKLRGKEKDYWQIPRFCTK